MSMKLSEFVRSIINEICDGVMEAANDVDLKTNRHPIAPGIVNGKTANFGEDKINFEISTYTKDTDSVDGTIKSEIFVVSGAVDKSKSNETQNISKISFSVPVEFRAVKKPK